MWRNMSRSEGRTIASKKNRRKSERKESNGFSNTKPKARTESENRPVTNVLVCALQSVHGFLTWGPWMWFQGLIGFALVFWNGYQALHTFRLLLRRLRPNFKYLLQRFYLRRYYGSVTHSCWKNAELDEWQYTERKETRHVGQLKITAPVAKQWLQKVSNMWKWSKKPSANWLTVIDMVFKEWLRVLCNETCTQKHQCNGRYYSHCVNEERANGEQSSERQEEEIVVKSQLPKSVQKQVNPHKQERQACQ